MPHPEIPNGSSRKLQLPCSHLVSRWRGYICLSAGHVQPEISGCGVGSMPLASQGGVGAKESGNYGIKSIVNGSETQWRTGPSKRPSEPGQHSDVQSEGCGVDRSGPRSMRLSRVVCMIAHSFN